MFKGKLESFIIKRSVILLSVLTILSLLFIRNKPIFLAGLILGWSFSVLRFFLAGASLTSLLIPGRRGVFIKSIIKYILSQASAFLLLILSGLVSTWMLFGAMAGLMTVPAVVFINSLTEGLGLTHNNFEQEGVKNGRTKKRA